MSNPPTSDAPMDPEFERAVSRLLIAAGRYASTTITGSREERTEAASDCDAMTAALWRWHLAQRAEARAEAVRECQKLLAGMVHAAETAGEVKALRQAWQALTALLPPEPGQRKEGV